MTEALKNKLPHAMESRTCETATFPRSFTTEFQVDDDEWPRAGSTRDSFQSSENYKGELSKDVHVKDGCAGKRVHAFNAYGGIRPHNRRSSHADTD